MASLLAVRRSRRAHGTQTYRPTQRFLTMAARTPCIQSLLWSRTLGSPVVIVPPPTRRFETSRSRPAQVRWPGLEVE